jgi:hypothetical protein
MPGQIQCVHCGQCGQEVNEPASTEAGDRRPCPACGSTSRAFGVLIESQVQLKKSLAFKARRQQGGKAFVEGKVASELHRDSGKFVRVERIIDRAKNWYREHISDRGTGDVIHHVEEPLSQHQGHGAAKRRSKPGPPDV